MRPELRRALAHVRASGTLLRLEMKVLTGNRLVLLALVELAWIVAIGVIQHFKDEPWTTAWFYNGSVVLPGLLPALALGMSAVMGERDVRHLEMTLASPGGRYQVWSFRLEALALTCLSSAFLCAVLTKVGIDHDFPIVETSLHALVPLAFVGALTVCISLLFNGAAVAALVASGLIVLEGIVLHPAGQAWSSKLDLFVNPLSPPESITEPSDWFRILVFNRGLYLTLTGLAVAGALALLQKRERLL